MRIHADLHGLLNILVKCICRKRDNGDPFCIRPFHGTDGLRRLQSVHHRHTYIHQDRRIDPGGTLLKHFHRDLSVFGMVCLDILELQDIRQDLRIDLHILGQQNPASRQLCPFLLLEDAHIAPTGDAFKAFDDIFREKRLCHEIMHADRLRFLLDIVPVIGSQYDYGTFTPVLLSDLFRGFRSAHAGHVPVHKHQIIGLFLRMLHFHPAQRFLSAGAGIRTDPHLFQNHFGMLGFDGIVIHNQDIHSPGIDLHGRILFPMITVPKCYRHLEFRSDALLRLNTDGTAHHFHDPLCDGHSQAAAAVFCPQTGIRRCKCIEDPGQKFLIHTDAGILYAKPQGRMILLLRYLLHRKCDRAGSLRKFNGIGQDVQQHFLQLYIIAEVRVIHIVQHAALKGKPLFPCLGPYHGVDLFHHGIKGEFLPVQEHTSGLDPAHIQNIIDDREQMLCTVSDLLQRFPGLSVQLLILQRKGIQSDDRIQRCPDLMTHAGQEGGLGLVGLFRRDQRVCQSFTLRHGITHLRIHIRNTQDDEMLTLFLISHAGDLHIDIDPAVTLLLAICDQIRILPVQRLHQIFALHGLQERFPVFRMYTFRQLGLAVAEEMPAAPNLRQCLAHFSLSVLDVLFRIRIDIVHIDIIPGQRLGDLRKHESGAYRAFIGLLRHGLLMLDPYHIRDIQTHAENTEPACDIRIFQFCGLELPPVSRSVRYIFIENIGFAERKRDPVVLREMESCLRIEDLGVRQSDDPCRRLLMRILREGLIAGQIFPGFRIFCEGHARHIIQQGRKTVPQFLNLLRFLPAAPAFFLLIIYYKCMQQCGPQHISDGIDRQERKPQLDQEAEGHDKSKGSQDPITYIFL